MRWVGVALLAILLGGCAAPVLPAAPDPEPVRDEPPPHRPNVWLLEGLRPATDTQVSGGAEPSILADRAGRSVWIGDTDGLHISTDNGTSWSDGAWPPAMGSLDGWTLAQDDAGALYFGTTAGPHVWVARSTDGGRTAAWTMPVADAAPVADRPWLAARGDGEVVLFFFDYGRTFTESCARSTDGGLTWLDRSVLFASPQGGNAAFDGEGRFHVGSDDGQVYRFDGSCLAPHSYDMFPQGKGSQHMLQVAIDGTDVYMAAPSEGNRAILLAGSRGLTGAPRHLQVSPPGLLSNTYATVAAQGGRVAVAWYGSETAGDPGEPAFAGSWNVYLALVDDFWGEPAVRHVRLSTEPNHVGDLCMDGIGCAGGSDRDLLDYFMADLDPWGGAHVAYGHDGDTSQATVRYAHVPPPPRPTAPAPAPPPGAPPPAAPTARFTSATSGLDLEVDASASGGGAGGLSYSWIWGDGSPAGSGVRASHRYAEPGTFRVRLTVADAAGARAEREATVRVRAPAAGNAAPLAGFAASPPAPAAGEAVLFEDRSTDEGRIVSWSWDLGDGATAEGPDVRHAYAAAGLYTVTLTVRDDQDATASAEQSLAVQDGLGGPGTDGARADAQAPAAAAAALGALLAAGLLRRRRSFGPPGQDRTR